MKLFQLFHQNDNFLSKMLLLTQIEIFHLFSFLFSLFTLLFSPPTIAIEIFQNFHKNAENIYIEFFELFAIVGKL